MVLSAVSLMSSFSRFLCFYFFSYPDSLYIPPPPTLHAISESPSPGFLDFVESISAGVFWVLFTGVLCPNGLAFGPDAAKCLAEKPSVSS